VKILLAESDEDIEACYTVMRALRPHIDESEFVGRVRRQEKSGYRLAMAIEAPEVVAVAGFRIGESLAWGRFLYVDDLVTAAAHRSQGYGSALLAWLRATAQGEGCDQLHLDSGLARERAHRFYAREGMERASYHFTMRVPSSGGPNSP